MNHSIPVDLHQTQPAISIRSKMLRFYISIFCILTVTITASGQSGSLKKTKISKEISLGIPPELVPMTEGQRIQKYVSNREPIAMFTSADGFTDFGINVNSSNWNTGDYDVLRKFYRSGILNLYDDVDFYRDTVQYIADRPFITFEFRGSLYGKEDSFRKNQSVSKYVYITYTLQEDRVLLFNLSTAYALRNQWRQKAHEMMQSIKIK
jgi:hypothetical protein